MRALAVAVLVLLSGSAARAQTPTPEPTATPFPQQEGAPTPIPAGVPPGYDDEIRPALTGSNGAASYDPAQPPAGFDTIPDPGTKPAHEEKWDPKKVFPGNYYALPLTVDFSFRPCLECKGVPANTPFLKRPGELSLWAGYVFQPYARESSPFMAGGVDWIFYENREDGGHSHRMQITPTWRVGYNWTAINAFGSFGIVIPGEDRNRFGYHVGIGTSSFAILAFSVCVGEVIPSVLEAGYDFLPPDRITGEKRSRFTLKLGWGF